MLSWGDSTKSCSLISQYFKLLCISSILLANILVRHRKTFPFRFGFEPNLCLFLCICFIQRLLAGAVHRKSKREQIGSFGSLFEYNVIGHKVRRSLKHSQDVVKTLSIPVEESEGKDRESNTSCRKSRWRVGCSNSHCSDSRIVAIFLSEKES